MRSCENYLMVALTTNRISNGKIVRMIERREWETEEDRDRERESGKEDKKIRKQLKIE